MNTSSPDELFMQRALDLAQLSRGSVSPNPLVGCVIVHNNIIIGEGRHEKYGEAHAEVNAVASVKDQTLLRQSTVYVNLEPCSHFGKTPPCADMLVKHQVKKVVIANIDPNPLVSEKGIQKLKDAGIEVITNIHEAKGRELNKRFFTFIEKKRPYIILKWAETADGFIARENFDSKWISNEHSRQLVHKWRSEEDAVLVGTGTALHDNPALTVRDWSGRNPTRIVIDRYGRLPQTVSLFDGQQQTLCYTTLKTETQKNLEFVKLNESSFQQSLVNDLYKRNIQSVLIEGGATTLQQFINNGLWDEARVFTSDQEFGSGITAPQFNGNLTASESVFSDTLTFYTREKSTFKKS
jgi:diaminohydroxyphosphoribosylaminopyrimidine deaminase/5-amino-6-(5-phosphoribosylamino)uracil reductase